MSTTQRHNFTFILPKRLRTMPIPFSKYGKHEDIDGTQTLVGYYSYDEYMALDGNSALETPNGTHVLLGESVTSIFDLATKLSTYISSIDNTIVIKEGVDVASWQDEVQDDYLWVLYSDPKLSYGYEEFKKVSTLFMEVTV